MSVKPLSFIKALSNFLSFLTEKSEAVYWLNTPDLKKIIYISPAYERIWGRSRDELYTNPEVWINYLHPEDSRDHHPIHAMAERLIKSGPAARYEESYRIIRPDGEVRWIVDRGFPVYDEHGVLCAVTGVAVDITKEKKVEEELKEAKERAEAASKAKSDFLAVMSHELRTPLNAILGMAQILANKKDITEEDKQQYLQIICQSVHSQLKLINDILQFTKADTGDIYFENKPFLLSNILNRLPNEYITLLEKNHLQLYIRNQCPTNLKLIGDEDRLHQVISNLVNNAIKFTDKGHITITAEEEPSTSEIYFNLKITVADTGRGIPREALETIFEKFTQIRGLGKDIYTRKNDGVGLGLAICKTFIERMNGRIEVESIVGIGSKFICHISLPLATNEKTVEELANISPAEKLLSNISSSNKDINLNKVGKILVVEDNKQNQLVVKLFLNQLSYDMEFAETGKDALNKLEQANNFDAVLMDVSLPDISGIEVIKQYRQFEDKIYHLPIIAVTAHTLPEDREACLAAGADGYLEKPLSIPVLGQKLSELIQKY